MRLASGSSGTAGAASSMRCISAGLSPSALMLGPFWESLAAIMDAADESGHEQTAKSAREPHGTHLCFRQNWGDEQNAQTAKPTQRAKARCDGCATQQNVHVPSLTFPVLRAGRRAATKKLRNAKDQKRRKKTRFSQTSSAQVSKPTQKTNEISTHAQISQRKKP